MTTYLLVHGGFHGGWCWNRVAPLLRGAGHDVYVPTLTGLGERSHLLTPNVDLETHIQDLLQVMFYEDLHGVVLVGHSAAGAVITAVAERAPDRIAHVVYLDALIPANGQSYAELLPPPMWAALREQATAHGEGWRLPPAPPHAFGLSDEADIAWAQARLSAQPMRPLEQPIRVGNPATARLPHTIIDCTQGLRGPSIAADAVASAQVWTERGWGYHTLDTGHDAMITAPRQLADVLLALRSGGGVGL